MAGDCPISLSAMTPVERIEGDSIEDATLLKKMAIEALEYVLSHEWCTRVKSEYLGYGVGGVVAIFLVQIDPARREVDPWLWVIVGDLPPAYIVADDNPTSADALDAYCLEMMNWVEAVERNESVEDLIPVNAPATRAYSAQLRGRIQFLRTQILPLARAIGRESS